MKKRFTEEQIVRIRQEADGGMDVSEVKRLKELKKMVAEQALDIRMLKDINAKKF